MEKDNLEAIIEEIKNNIEEFKKHGLTALLVEANTEKRI